MENLKLSKEVRELGYEFLNLNINLVAPLKKLEKKEELSKISKFKLSMLFRSAKKEEGKGWKELLKRVKNLGAVNKFKEDLTNEKGDEKTSKLEAANLSAQNSASFKCLNIALQLLKEEGDEEKAKAKAKKVFEALKKVGKKKKVEVFLDFDFVEKGFNEFASLIKN